ncbi:MAG: transposase [Gammaproteobacteria bacterium]|nr:transposase [Gammaproteobacteria bacterium]
MPRRARLMLPHVPVHVIQRGNNRQACFFADDDYRFYLDWLGEYAEREVCRLHAYVLMTNHVHLLLSSDTAQGVGRLMKRLGQRYVQYINRSYRRSGTLWEGRYRSCLAGEGAYVLSCYRYIELNPVRAAMVEHPGQYRWSSYGANAQGEASELLTPHSLYKRLGVGAKERQRAYRDLFRYQLDSGLVDQIRKATNGNYALGSERFEQEVATMLRRRVTPGKSGRPSSRSEKSG